MSQAAGDGPIVAIVEQHAEEASFLWAQRVLIALAPHVALADLARLDERLEAHLDGLRVAGSFGWELARTGLEAGEPGAVFAAAVLAFEGTDAERQRVVLELGTAKPQLSRAVESALAWLPYAQVEKTIHELLVSTTPALRKVALSSAAAHRQVPRGGLLGLLNDVDLTVRARALRAAGELGQTALHPTVRKHLKASDPACRFWSAWSATRLADDPEALAALQAFAVPGGRFGERAVQLAIRRQPPAAARSWQKSLTLNTANTRLAIAAAGALGLPDLVPWLIERMKEPPFARVAGEAFSLITGAHIAYDRLEGAKPEGFESGPTENPEDDDVAMDPDEHLAWPDPAAVLRYWDRRKGDLTKGTRYLLGRPIEPAGLELALRDGRQRQRAAAALELAVLQPGRPLFETRTPGPRQVAALGKSV
jgi:uncharacterized protein (TIGR02270 family)